MNAYVALECCCVDNTVHSHCVVVALEFLWAALFRQAVGELSYQKTPPEKLDCLVAPG